ncbi:class E sortase [Streptomyces sp. NRRL F-5123]|uniref:class E sortase n=1 Tax=Streptomyces sp. NRRL F-5123 TaxID=1463856 RepID=UPI0004E1D543|nr:class E sortase [Streptomyces sp. NRRL F-5123]
MTTLRPERPADDGPMSYESTGQFRAVVEQLDDPLNDPLPGRPAAVPEEQQEAPGGRRPRDVPEVYAEQGPGPEQLYAPAPQAFAGPASASPWVSPGQPVEAAPAPAAPWASPAQPVEAAPAPAALPYEPPPPGPVPYEEAPAPAAVPYPVPAAPAPYDEPAGPVPYDEPAADVPDGGPADGGGHTAVLPVSVPEAAAAATAAASVAAPSPADGGRAARRKAARQGGGGHRARGGGGQNGAGQAAQAQSAAPTAPLSRVEARRAAKAAKDSPAVIASRVVGELFITAGVLMLLFVTYQLWWTNVRAHREAAGAANNLQQKWDNESADPNRLPGTFSPGQGFAIMYIPKLDVKAPIAQGVSKHNVLDKGMIGHYDGSLNTAMPWDKTGNFAVAAHRNTHGEPFRYINHLTAGDKVVVETENEYYTYVITSSLASTPPSNISVLKPIPDGSGFTAPGRYLTLTTCTPEFTSTNRLIVWGKLIEERPRSKGKPDALVAGD